MREHSAIALRASASITATDTGAAVDVSKFTGNVHLLLNSSLPGAGKTSDVKIQHSDDGSTGWADSGVAFEQVSTTKGFQSLYTSADQFKKFVRVVNTLAGTTPSVVYGVTLIGDQTGN